MGPPPFPYAPDVGTPPRPPSKDRAGRPPSGIARPAAPPRGGPCRVVCFLYFILSRGAKFVPPGRIEPPAASTRQHRRDRAGFPGRRAAKRYRPAFCRGGRLFLFFLHRAAALPPLPRADISPPINEADAPALSGAGVLPRRGAPRFLRCAGRAACRCGPLSPPLPRRTPLRAVRPGRA